MKNIFLLLLAFVFSFSVSASEREVSLKSKGFELYGTLEVPYNFTSGKVILIIAGSGPTDRDGNNSMMKNNSLKMVAEDLSRSGIATLRYDKRLAAQSVSTDKNYGEKDLTFDDYINDAKAWVKYLREKKEFKEIYILGHSEGALIGMAVAVSDPKLAGFISAAGPGRSMDKILKEQLATQPEKERNEVYRMIDLLKKGERIKSVPANMQVLFRESIQPFLISYFKNDPVELIAKITSPILIIQGDTDIQVKVLDAELLKKANPKAELEIIKNMNHVLKYCNTTERNAQMLTYTSVKVPISSAFSLAILDFLGVEGYREY